MGRGPLAGVVLALVTLALVATPAGGGAVTRTLEAASVPTNVDISRRLGNESEEAIAVSG